MPVCVKPHSCRSCHKKFADEERLTNHQSRAHGSEEFKTIQCNICSKRFLNNSALGSHLRTHNDQGALWECSICKETYCSRDGLKRHVASHSNNGSFPCPYCQKEFSGYLSIRKHIIKTHKSSGVQCSLCERFCSSAQKYEEHMLRHANQIQLSCVLCEKQFKRNDKLKEHIKRMHSEKDCDPVVEAETKQLEEEKLEKRREERLRDLNAQYLFKCTPCLLGFKRRGMLVNHIAKYHPTMDPDEVPELSLPIMQTTRDFYCHLCEKVYKSNAKRKAHILKFHPGAFRGEQLKNTSFDQPAGTVAKKPEQCLWCHKQYATNAKLLQHMRNKHPDKACNIAELRKRGSKPRVERDPVDSAKHNFYEEQVSKIIESIANESISEKFNVDSCSNEMLVVESIADELNSPEMFAGDSAEADLNSPEMFVVEMKDDGVCSLDTQNVTEVEIGAQLEPLMTDDDFTLAVCLIMSHPSMSNVEEAAQEALLGSAQCQTIKKEISSCDLIGAEKEKTLEGSSLTAEDEDLLMAEWLVDLQAGPSHPANAVPVIQRAFPIGIQSEVAGSMTDLCGPSLSDDDNYTGSDYHLYEMNAVGTTHLPPLQVVYSPYPPH